MWSTITLEEVHLNGKKHNRNYPKLFLTFWHHGCPGDSSRWQFLIKFISVSQVTAGFDTTNMLTALPSSFLEPLLSLSLTEDPEIRLLVLQILLSLIDRHDNAPKFLKVRWALEKNIHWIRTCQYLMNSAWYLFVFAASFQTSLCSSSKLTNVPGRTTYSWKRFLFSF